MLFFFVFIGKGCLSKDRKSRKFQKLGMSCAIRALLPMSLATSRVYSRSLMRDHRNMITRCVNIGNKEIRSFRTVACSSMHTSMPRSSSSAAAMGSTETVTSTSGGGGGSAASSADADWAGRPPTSVVTPEQRSQRVDSVFQGILSLSVLEILELNKRMKTQFGYDPAAFAHVQSPSPSAASGAAAGTPGGAAKPAVAAAEKTEWTVKLEKFDEAKKIAVIKEVRTITGLGLKEAKDLVTEAPKIVKKGLKKDEANKIAEQIRQAGGVVAVE